jgi:hypothetical protein
MAAQKRSAIDLYRFTYFSGIDPNGDPLNIPQELQLNFGPAATLDDGRRWRFAVEQVHIRIDPADPAPTRNFAILLAPPSSAQGLASQKTNAPGGRIPLVVCPADFHADINTNSTIGIQISNTSFLNETLFFEIRDSSTLDPVVGVISSTITFVAFAV